MGISRSSSFVLGSLRLDLPLRSYGLGRTKSLWQRLTFLYANIKESGQSGQGDESVLVGRCDCVYDTLSQKRSSTASKFPTTSDFRLPSASYFLSYTYGCNDSKQLVWNLGSKTRHTEDRVGSKNARRGHKSIVRHSGSHVS